MTLRSDVARGRDLLACWRELAEERLAYLTEMFESGRWRRYYSEYTFLENIKEAKNAVETWRALATPSPVRNSIIELSWSAPERVTGLRKGAPRSEAQAPDPPSEMPVIARAEVPSAPVVDMLALQRVLNGTPATERAINERYPLLRNSL